MLRPFFLLYLVLFGLVDRISPVKTQGNAQRLLQLALSRRMGSQIAMPRGMSLTCVWKGCPKGRCSKTA
jgi:hypothetical protein